MEAEVGRFDMWLKGDREREESDPRCVTSRTCSKKLDKEPWKGCCEKEIFEKEEVADLLPQG